MLSRIKLYSSDRKKFAAVSESKDFASVEELVADLQAGRKSLEVDVAVGSPQVGWFG